ncbi:MAG TPA: hypothetical protein VMS98_00920 [Thermoanaerobaculia bacterium]|nr:hypothetical protein [Thermoanaerobaculia bacterium]
MKMLVVGVALTLVACPAFAAIEYEFVQTNRMPNSATPTSDFSAKAVIDGTRSRVDFRSGNAFPPGTYVLSTDGARRLRFVDPKQKAYTEMNTLGIASAIGSSDITIANLKHDIIRLPETQIIAGIPAEHYRQTIAYTITVRFGSMPLTQNVRTEIDKWTTNRFGDITDALGTNRIQTGNAEIDEIIAAETSKIRGFPLKQTIRITTTDANAVRRASQSELKLPSSRTRTREMTVTSIRETKPDESMFTVPAEYKRNDFAERAHKSQMQVLSMEPAGE